MKQAQNYKKLFKILPITFLLLIRFLNQLKFSKKTSRLFSKI